MEQTKIAHFSFSSAGGAGAVASLTSEILLAAGHDSTHYFQTHTDLRGSPHRFPAQTLAAGLDNYVIRKPSAASLFSVSRSRLKVSARIENYDIVHLHWWQGLDLNHLRRSNPEAKFVFSLHDERALTGGCHSPGICSGYSDSCANCPMAHSLFHRLIEKQRELTRSAFKSLGNISFVAPNHWVADRAVSSGISELGSVTTISNPIAETFLSNTIAKSSVMDGQLRFGFVANDVDDANKRFWLARSIVQGLRSQGWNATLEVVGRTRCEPLDHEYFFGTMASVDVAKRAVNWSFLLSTSVSETFSLVIAEMALLGVPTVATSAGGNVSVLAVTDQVPVLFDSYSALSEADRDRLERLIELYDDDRRKALMSRAREKFSNDRVLKQLLEVYGVNPNS